MWLWDPPAGYARTEQWNARPGHGFQCQGLNEAGTSTVRTRPASKSGRSGSELARELFPGATTVALLVNPANPLAATVSKDLQAVANTLGVRLHVLHASAEADFEAAFATAAQLRVAALVIGRIRCSAATPRSSAHSPSATAFQQSIFCASSPPPAV